MDKIINVMIFLFVFFSAQKHTKFTKIKISLYMAILYKNIVITFLYQSSYTHELLRLSKLLGF